jgi:hypothetical protein
MTNRPEKLPEQLLKKATRTLAEMNIGETAFVQFSALLVNREHDCYLNRKRELCEDGPFSIRVVRDQEGYHVATIARAFGFEPADFKTDKLIPVASVEILEGDAWHQ